MLKKQRAAACAIATLSAASGLGPPQNLQPDDRGGFYLSACR